MVDGVKLNNDDLKIVPYNFYLNINKKILIKK